MATTRSPRLAVLASAVLLAATLAACDPAGLADPANGNGSIGSSTSPSGAAGTDGAPATSGGTSGGSSDGGTSGATPGGTSDGTAGAPAPSPSAKDPTWVDVTDFGAVGDGAHDDSAAFQAATNTGKTVWVPRPSAFYKVTAPIQLLASIVGDTSDLGNLPMIRMFGSNGDGYHTTFVVRGHHGAGELLIAGLQIDNQYVSGTSGGEWDHNITISDSDNVRVSTSRLLNAWGDAVCIGEWKRAPSNPELDCKNIVVENCYIENPFRCTVAPLFTSAGTVIRKNYHRKINRSDNGTFIPPIDIEPDFGPQNSVVWDVLIEDNVVDTHTSDGANLYFIWITPGFSSAPTPVRGTRVRNNRGYWYAVSNGALAEDTGNVMMDPAPAWQMQPFSG